MQKFHWWYLNEATGLMRCSLDASVTFQEYTAACERPTLIPNKTLKLSGSDYSLWTWIESDLTLGWRRE